MSTEASSPKDGSSRATLPNDTKARARRRRPWTIWIAALCILGGGGGYLLSQRASGPETGKQSGKKGGGGAVPVSVDKVRQGNIGVYINAIGTVTPVYTVTVTSRVVGELVSVHYREGQIVHKGDLLAEIDARPYQASLVQAQGQLARDQALLKNAYIDLNRYKEIYAEHAIPEQQLATQQAQVEQDEGTVKLDQGLVDAAEINVDYARIIAPIDGRVGLRSVDPGNIVQANGTTGLLTITQLQPITVIFTMAEDYVSEVVHQMQGGHSLRVDALDRDDQMKLAEGTVLTLDNQIDTTTGTVRVRATFPNRDNKLFPNEFVNARLLVRTLHSVNLIPSAAIQRNNDVAFVYVVNADKTVRTRDVKLATTDVNTAAVTGVNPGETVVVDGFDKLQDGTKISIRGSSDSQDNAAGTPPEPAPAESAAPQQGESNTQVNPNQQNSQQTPQPKAHRK